MNEFAQFSMSRIGIAFGMVTQVFTVRAIKERTFVFWFYGLKSDFTSETYWDKILQDL